MDLNEVSSIESYEYTRDEVLSLRRNGKFIDYFEDNKYNIDWFDDGLCKHDHHDVVINQLYNTFMQEPRLNKIVKIIAKCHRHIISLDVIDNEMDYLKLSKYKIDKTKPVLTSYTLYIYDNDFKIYAHIDDNLYEYSFILSDDYNNIPFLMPLDNSYLKSNLALEARHTNEIYFKSVLYREVYRIIYIEYKRYTNTEIYKSIYPLYGQKPSYETFKTIYPLYDQKLSWEILKTYMDNNDYTMSLDYINKHPKNISLLINMIDYIFNEYTGDINYYINYYMDIILQWSKNYMHEYNKDPINILYFSGNIYYIYYPEKRMEHKISNLIPKLHYYIATIMISLDMVKTNKDKKYILNNLQLADNYKDAKELLPKLFFEYIGLPFGSTLDININNPTIGDMFDLATILNNNK